MNLMEIVGGEATLPREIFAQTKNSLDTSRVLALIAGWFIKLSEMCLKVSSSEVECRVKYP